MTARDAIVGLAAELPDAGKLSFATFSGAFGGFVGGLAGRARRRPKEEVLQMVADGVFVGFGAGFVCWLVAVAMDWL